MIGFKFHGIITKDNVVNIDLPGNVEAIIELKFKPWEYVHWQDDIGTSKAIFKTPEDCTGT